MSIPEGRKHTKGTSKLSTSSHHQIITILCVDKRHRRPTIIHIFYDHGEYRRPMKMCHVRRTNHVTTMVQYQQMKREGRKKEFDTSPKIPAQKLSWTFTAARELCAPSIYVFAERERNHAFLSSHLKLKSSLFIEQLKPVDLFFFVFCFSYKFFFSSFHFSCGLVFGVTHFPGQNGFWFSMVGQKCKTPLFRENKSLHSAKFSFYTNESLNSFKGSTVLFLNFKGWNRAPLSYCQKQLSLNITNTSSPQTTTTWMFLSNKHILYLMVYKSTKLSWELSRA